MEKEIFAMETSLLAIHDCRHAFDGMHLTKNVYESALGILMAHKGKGKDSLETRQGLQEMNVRRELHPIVQADGKKKLPVASWTLQKDEKEKICSFFDELKVPTGYSSNIKRLVNTKELKFNMSCMKAHDCHVIMTQLLLVALCFLKKNNLALILWMKSRSQHLASYMSRIRSLRTRWQLVKLGPGMM